MSGTMTAMSTLTFPLAELVTLGMLLRVSSVD